jgi:hypothetical protein
MVGDRCKEPFRRVATIEGSRGFQPTDLASTPLFRRVATVEGSGVFQFTPAFDGHELNTTNDIRRDEIKRRYATHSIGADDFRGLKPTATITSSLRD